ncbi:MAG TPA: type III-A CRISPR-associated RAMP protein Csm4 [Candidatus Aminicenantes bacterium]|nr:MAG: type III-A CRISPR-associated RAMP protein Csm4 [Candidatus Aminicenantes bacterium]HEK86296.1 type III-A CRISPR-associated RAMP protein Csm4 [Candidatus Aminicenantes bacterium]
MRYLGIKLTPRSFLHLGEREGWLEGSRVYIPSDTLFSALCHSHLLLYGEIDSFISAFKQPEPPFLISSAFPFWGQDYYFPLPKNQLAKTKELKKIKFVNLVLLKRLLAGDSLEDLSEEIKTNLEYDVLPRWESKAKAKARKNEKLVPWEIENVPRVSLNRLNNHPGENFFYFGQVKFVRKSKDHEEAGLFVLVKAIEKEWEKKVKALFRLLCDEGIGGDRTSGKGLFHQPEFFELDFPEIPEANACYAASSYFPSEEELVELEKAYYEVEERKGYIFSPANRSFRRRSLRLFVEGSVFPGLSRKGTLQDVTPEIFTGHRVYRYGLLLSFPCKLEET